MEITTIAELLKALGELGEAAPGYTRFFRGHSCLSYLLESSIYRLDKREDTKDKAYLINNEEKIIRDAITSCPDSFSPNDSLFEKLVKLQHYGYATRLLDLTSNALVGLYFAVQGGEGTDGELVVLDIPNTEIKYDDSDVVTILSAISLRNADFNVSDYLEIADEEAGIARNIYQYEEEERVERDLQDQQQGGAYAEFYQSKFYKEMVSRRADEMYRGGYIEFFNQQKDIERLLHDIRHDKPSFTPIIDPKDLNRVVCVRAKLNNPRITRQQGCFLLFGMNGEKQNPAKVKKEWIRSLEDKKLIIKNESKQKILRELRSFGISRQTLFPELDAQAQDIMEQYRL
ncbi:FRG domain-containing protein [Neisseria animaloris]|uniref:FRG domain-containing protein n=1 Tax=Neisseria animaloris TaxID=326522 RepID=UPI000D386ABA|nr:FRG domain-containing protein [Neisseria animaloris]